MPRALRSTIESLVGVQGGEPDLTYASWKSERKPDNVAQKVCKGNLRSGPAVLKTSYRATELFVFNTWSARTGSECI